MHALVSFSHILAGPFTTPEVYPRGLQALGFTAGGYRISLIYLKLFHKLYALLTAGAIHPYAGDRLLLASRTSTLDQFYHAVGQALDNLVREIGLEMAA
ncbi:hypothetical protein SBA3_1220007 [Candidatus Sulfopaludibacter sp. SbA3]|nr:hypothetical protein SBA3_1220007 [Candidatus Sulfopaludibacter sp. SbA3]